MNDKKLSASRSCYPMVRSQNNQKKKKKLRRKWAKLYNDADVRPNFDDSEEVIQNYSICDHLGEPLEYSYKNVKFNNDIYKEPNHKLKRTMTQLCFTNYNKSIEQCYDSRDYFVEYLPEQLPNPYPSQMYLPNDPNCFNIPEQINLQTGAEYLKSPKYYDLPSLNEVPQNMDYANDLNVKPSSKGTRKKHYTTVLSNHYDDEWEDIPYQEWEDIPYVQDEPLEAKEVYICELEWCQMFSTGLAQDNQSEQSVKKSIGSKKSTSDRVSEKISSNESVIDQSEELSPLIIPERPATPFIVEDKKPVSENVEDVLNSSGTQKDLETENIDSPRTENQTMFSALSDPTNKKIDSDETLLIHEHDPPFNHNDLLKYSAENQGNIITRWLDSFFKQSYTLGFSDLVETASSINKAKNVLTDRNTQYPDSNELLTEMKTVEYKGETLKDLKLPEVCKICLKCADKKRQRCNRRTNTSPVYGEDPKYDWLKKYPIDCIYLKVTNSNGEHSFINPIIKQEVKIYPMKDMKIGKVRRRESKKSSGFDADKHTVSRKNAQSRKMYSVKRKSSTANGRSLSMSAGNSIRDYEDRHSVSSETDGTYIIENLQSTSA